MLETRSQKDSRKRTRWIWRKKRTESTDTDHDEPEQIQSKLPKISMMTKIDIPNDIVIEILSRLPGKSLLQFKWACKYWYDLITKDSSFAKLQLVKYAINNPLLMFSSYSYSEKYASLILSSLSCTKLVEVGGGLIDVLPSVTRLFKSHRKSSVPTVVGSCNGLLCMRKQTRDALNHDVIGVTICIWNPCTNEFKDSILEPIVDFPEGMNHRYNFVGFGYDQTIDDYMVISNTTLWAESDDTDYATVTQVYTLGTNSWKRIGNYHPFYLCSMIKFVPNVASFYCIGRRKSSLRSFFCVILCFDIAKEEYREISKPWFVRDLLMVQLIELNGCLCIAQNVIYPSGVEVWMVKDYCHDDLNKNESSWTKLYTIRQPDILRDGFHPLGIFNKNNGGEILLLSEQNLVWYNEKDDKICKTISLKVCGSVSKVVAYVENFVSLNSGTYMRLEEEEEQTITRRKHQQEKFISYIL